MVFSSITFLIYFLLLLFAAYFLMPARFRGMRNLVLLIFSLIFYAYGGVKYLPLLLTSVAINYLGGLFAGDRFSGRVRSCATLLTVTANLLLLGWFKYAGFFAQMINDLGVSVPVPQIVLPIGISFFTFQGLSYVIDVRRGDAQVQKNPLNVALYVVLFPQLVAGPIVRYTTVAEEIGHRRETLDDFAQGSVRFMIGLGKKMLMANPMSEIADGVFALVPGEMSVALAWVGAVAYTFQIYFDFSAYSDMAIGLGRIFGFHFLENFNYPYIARSITDFWRRWHISLSTWFRDYVYIPLGGNRCSPARHICNIAVVWLLTGLWHGAAWTFVAWGGWFGVLLLCEKYLWTRAVEKAPRVLASVYTMLAVILSWVLFRSATFTYALDFIKAMFGVGGHALYCGKAAFYLRQYFFYLLICCVGALPVKNKLRESLSRHSDRLSCQLVLEWGPKFWALGVLMLSYMKLATGSFNPFIYFQF